MAATRRAPGEGTLYFDNARGLWIGQGQLPPDPLTGRRRRVKVVQRKGETKGKVAERLRSKLAEVDRAGAAPGTVGELVESWLSRAAPKRMSPASMDTAHRLIRTHVMPALGPLKVGEVSVETVERWLDALVASGLARATVVKVRGLLAQAFDFGVSRRHVSWNPARLAELPASDEPERQGRALTGPEARAMLNAAVHRRNGAWIVVALTMGLRPGEVSGLTWPAVDVDIGRVVVHQSLAWTGKVPALKGTKTGKSRTLDLPPRTVEALKAHRATQVRERLLMGDRWPSRWADLVFITEAGTPLYPSNLRRMVADVANDGGIEGVVRPYDLRHSATSLLSAAGVAPELLADLLGHVDTRMVFRHYRHPVTPTVSVAADHIDRALEL